MAEIKTEPFDVGDEIVIWAEFVNAAGAPANPTAATLQIEKPEGAELPTRSLPDFAIPTLGRLEYHYVIADGGQHAFRWAASGAFAIAAEGSFGVRQPRLTTPAP